MPNPPGRAPSPTRAGRRCERPSPRGRAPGEKNHAEPELSGDFLDSHSGSSLSDFLLSACLMLITGQIRSPRFHGRYPPRKRSEERRPARSAVYTRGVSGVSSRSPTSSSCSSRDCPRASRTVRPAGGNRRNNPPGCISSPSGGFDTALSADLTAAETGASPSR